MPLVSASLPPGAGGRSGVPAAHASCCRSLTLAVPAPEEAAKALNGGAGPWAGAGSPPAAL
eukprot:4355348-Lingulodinium_polyedra.AAC.1